jgi:hypothetical protein
MGMDLKNRFLDNDKKLVIRDGSGPKIKKMI